MNFEQYIAVEWLLVAICVIITTARLVVRSWKGIWRYWLSDLFLVLSLLFFIPIVAGDTYIFSIGQTFDTVEYTEPLAIWWFASTLIFDLGFYLARFSLLAFYYQLFPVSEVKPRILLWVVVAFNIGGLLATGFIDTFWCGANVSLNWASGDTACAASDDPVTAYIVWPLNVASEVFVFLLPFSILQRLNKLNKKEKTSLICIFLLGCATIAASVARFTLGVTNLFTLEAYLMGSVETAIQIIVVALPALRPLLSIMPRRRNGASGERSEGQGSGAKARHKFSSATTDFTASTSKRSRANITLTEEGESRVELQDMGGRPAWEDVELPKYLGGNS